MAADLNMMTQSLCPFLGTEIYRNVQLAGSLYQVSFHIFINIINIDIEKDCDFNKCNATFAVTESKIFFYLNLPVKIVSHTDICIYF